MERTALASLSLKIALAATFLSAVASRLILWGKQSAGWDNLLTYTADVNSFVPPKVVPSIAVELQYWKLLFKFC